MRELNNVELIRKEYYIRSNIWKQNMYFSFIDQTRCIYVKPGNDNQAETHGLPDLLSTIKIVHWTKIAFDKSFQRSTMSVGVWSFRSLRISWIILKMVRDFLPSFGLQ